ncbi:MAG: FimB/Mfa2 family fimbrial subunit [Bacteroidales bacterium]|nr:FimB/Mfa2 family fimbrial subunit [Bacteroidales bacterium]
MKKTLKNIFRFAAGAILPAIAAVLCLSSCEDIQEDLEPCPSGLKLSFVYDYNMEFANAFPSQVDCLTLFVYDAEGNYVTTRTAGKEQTSDKDWRMTIDLPGGHYRLLAYGGMNCDDASFTFASDPAKTSFSNLEVFLHPSLITEPVGKYLHPLFYGRLDITVPEISTGYKEATVSMMRDTNDIRILLANENGVPIDASDFVFSITDNNTRFNSLNEIISTENVSYRPWAKGNSVMGVNPDGTESLVAWAELSVPRFMVSSDARLNVSRQDGTPVLSLPLIDVLCLYKSQRYANMANQEFLDRENTWNMTFFLTGQGVWAGVSIIINDWVVRINNSEL